MNGSAYLELLEVGAATNTGSSCVRKTTGFVQSVDIFARAAPIFIISPNLLVRAHIGLRSEVVHFASRIQGIPLVFRV